MPLFRENLRFWSVGRREAGMRPSKVVGVRAFAVTSFCLALFSGCVFETRRQGPSILFMGNSITRNLPVPSLDWTGDWGMAATALDRDYAHQTVRLLKEKGLELEMTLADRNCPDCDGAIDEQIHNMDQVRRLHPRYVVLQLSEHSGEIELRSGKMTDQYRRLLQGLKDAGVPHVYCLSSWGEKDVNGPHATGILMALKDFPEYAYVDITPVATDTLNYGDSTLFTDVAVRWHPGDRGMLGIAETLSGAIWEDR
ncbi:MAG: hypothetical protein JWO30_1298 [Fibrobacteres bacterium]|nr:hypothetical protein [Fibrobacterota bacterium]